MSKKKFMPIILGTYINTYTMAASFHEKYGLKSVCVAKFPMRFTEGSSIISNIHYYDDLIEKDRFVPILKEIYDMYKDEAEELILVGTNDHYVNLIINNQEELGKYYTFNYISQELRDQIYYKKNFYQLCEKYDMPIPKTYFYDCDQQEKVPSDLTFPVIVKPSNVVEYQLKGLFDVFKVYKAENQADLEDAIQKVVDGGYKEDLIIQEFIPGSESTLWDAVYYGNQEGEAQLITLAQVALQERDMHYIGSYTALITRYEREFMEKLVNFMEDIGYQGFANFDMKKDPRDGKIKIFEVNVRQGRSSSYINLVDHHLAEYFVDDLIYNKDKELTYLDEEVVFSMVPNFVLKKFVESDDLLQDIKRLTKQKKIGNPLLYKGDKGFKHNLNMRLRKYNYYRKYKNTDRL